MCNEDLRNEIRIANVKQWEVADAIGISEMTMVKWLRKELSPDKKAMVRNVFQMTRRKMIPLVMETEKQSITTLTANNQISI